MNATDVIGWTPEPQTRGTIGLVWSCLATIFLCTWSAVHPNLPAEDEGPRHIIWRRMLYLLGALLAPEWICMLAVAEVADARAVQAKSPGWSLAQCFYLIMGGFIVKGDDRPIRLEPVDLLRLLESHALSWPESIEPDILDRSKADWVLKAVALAQAIWFIAQIIGRAAQGLSVTALELFTLAMISCALVTYMAWWAKPFDVHKATVLKLEKAVPDDMQAIRRVGLPTQNRRIADAGLASRLFLVCVILVFGALHLAGWRFHFPTEIEKWLWRASSVLCVTLPLLVVLAIYFDLITERLGISIGVLYVICRLYMMVEMFVSLRAVPADVYKTPQWSQYLPSFG